MIIPTYPKFDANKYNNVVLDLTQPYCFTYQDESGEHMLSIDGDGVLMKPDNKYDKNDSDWGFEVRVSRIFTIKNADILYGTDGIACHDAKIGICVMWTSSSSYQRGVYDLGYLQKTSEMQQFEFNGKIAGGSLCGKITFTMMFYIKEEGHPAENEAFLANTKGMLVGDIDDFSILLDGVPDFPIRNFSQKNGPLWDVICNWNGINDSFLDTVCIYFNTANPLYRYVDKANTQDFDVNLVREIIASALLQIIEKYREYDENFSQLDSATEGSVADYVGLYLKGWGVDYTSLNTMSRELRKKLEEKIANI